MNKFNVVTTMVLLFCICILLNSCADLKYLVKRYYVDDEKSVNEQNDELYSMRNNKTNSCTQINFSKYVMKTYPSYSLEIYTEKKCVIYDWQKDMPLVIILDGKNTLKLKLDDSFQSSGFESYNLLATGYRVTEYYDTFFFHFKVKKDQMDAIGNANKIEYILGGSEHNNKYLVSDDAFNNIKSFYKDYVLGNK